MSCTNEVDDTQQSNAKLSSSAKLNYKTIIDLNNTKSQNLATYSLNPTEINEIWQLKLENFEKNNKLNSRQQDFISKLKSVINSELFTQNSDYRKYFLQNEKDKFMIEAKKLFGENEGWYLLTKIENINQRFEKNKLLKENENSRLPGGPGGEIRACDCDNTPDCKRITGLGWISISWEYGTCSNSTCYVETFLGIWESDNDGRCVY